MGRSSTIDARAEGTAPFPRASRFTRGYHPRQVDAFVQRAEAALRPDGHPGSSPRLTAADVRRAGFDLVRHGYDVRAVDTYLDRLEEQALRLEQALAATSQSASEAAPDAAPGPTQEGVELADSLDGEPGRRFARAGRLSRGYRPSDVDVFVDELLPVLRGDSDAISADGVRRSVFRGRRGGYSEAAVDDALDAAVDLLLRRRAAAGPTLSDGPGPGAGPARNAGVRSSEPRTLA